MIKGWVGLVGWPVADGLTTIVVTHYLQVERGTGKVRRPETDVLLLYHATNCHAAQHILTVPIIFPPNLRTVSIVQTLFIEGRFLPQNHVSINPLTATAHNLANTQRMQTRERVTWREMVCASAHARDDGHLFPGGGADEREEVGDSLGRLMDARLTEVSARVMRTNDRLT